MGTELHEGLSRRDGELDIVKHRISPFYATHLEAVLRANAVEQLCCRACRQTTSFPRRREMRTIATIKLRSSKTAVRRKVKRSTVTLLNRSGVSAAA